MIEVYLDVSELPAPEPFEQIMQALASMAEDEYLKVSHRKQPLLLFRPLAENGYDFHVQTGAVHAFDIFIWRQEQAPPGGLVMPSIAEVNNPPGRCTDD